MQLRGKWDNTKYQISPKEGKKGEISEHKIDGKTEDKQQKVLQLGQNISIILLNVYGINSAIKRENFKIKAYSIKCRYY